MHSECERIRYYDWDNFFNTIPIWMIQNLIYSWNDSVQLLYWRPSQIKTALCSKCQCKAKSYHRELHAENLAHYLAASWMNLKKSKYRDNR